MSMNFGCMCTTRQIRSSRFAHSREEISGICILARPLSFALSSKLSRGLARLAPATFGQLTEEGEKYLKGGEKGGLGLEGGKVQGGEYGMEVVVGDVKGLGIRAHILQKIVFMIKFNCSTSIILFPIIF